MPLCVSRSRKWKFHNTQDTPALSVERYVGTLWISLVWRLISIRWLGHCKTNGSGDLELQRVQKSYCWWCLDSIHDCCCYCAEVRSFPFRSCVLILMVLLFFKHCPSSSWDYWGIDILFLFSAISFSMHPCSCMPTQSNPKQHAFLSSSDPIPPVWRFFSPFYLNWHISEYKVIRT